VTSKAVPRIDFFSWPHEVCGLNRGPRRQSNRKDQERKERQQLPQVCSVEIATPCLVVMM
jgi:hypothetical protein